MSGFFVNCKRIVSRCDFRCQQGFFSPNSLLSHQAFKRAGWIVSRRKGSHVNRYLVSNTTSWYKLDYAQCF
jgi:hypothetical protein